MDLTALLLPLAGVLATVLAYEARKLVKRTKTTVDDALVEEALKFVEDPDVRAKAVAAVLKLFGK